MTTPIVPTLTDELIAELEAAANAATPGPWDHIRINDISWVASEDWEILDLRCDKPLDAEDGEYIAKANPTTIMALLAHIADLKQQLAAASVDAERWRYAKADTSAGKSDICVVKKIWGDGCKDTQEIILTEADADAAIDAARDIAGSD